MKIAFICIGEYALCTTWTEEGVRCVVVHMYSKDRAWVGVSVWLRAFKNGNEKIKSIVTDASATTIEETAEFGIRKKGGSKRTSNLDGFQLSLNVYRTFLKDSLK